MMYKNNYYFILYLLILIIQLINAINNDKKQILNNLLINNKSSTSINHSIGELKYTEIPDDCSYIKPMIYNLDDISLICSLRTINSEFDTTNFSVIPSDHTIDLKVICNDDLMIKSNLEAKSFAHLTKLKALTIKFCKISQFHSQILYGLKELKNLTIQTDNIIWIDFILNIEHGSFDSTKNLERLDISKNNIWTLPIGIFCPLSRLIFLNISENRLQDINELSFRDKIKSDDITNLTTKLALAANLTCTLDLEILDMSYNNFVLLPINGFGILKRLKILKLNNNEISMIADKALNGLKNLKIINLNSNKIVALPSELFLDCSNSIQEIYLQNNSITVLSSKLFSNLEQLQALDLSFNQITSNWIDKNTFIGLIRLVLLNLSHNKITKLESDYFLDLYTLQILNLKHNQLDNIEANTFSLMNNLHTLLLSYNNLKYLSGHALNGLYVLSLLSLDNNNLNDINSDAFRNCSSLQDINLNGNQLKYIPIALRNMRLLRTIDLGENLINNIDNDTFKDLHNLYGLRLIGNNITKINSNAFKDLPNLQILNLAHNKIIDIELNSFKIIPKIQAIRLDGNLLKNIDNLFDKISSLLWLNISDNKLIEFDFKSIPLSLQWLDIHKNDIKYLSNSLKLQLQLNNTELKLQTLDASFNQINKITPNSIPNSMELLFLNDNQITIIEPNSFKYKLNLTRVDLYANQIQSLDEKSFRIEPVTIDKQLPEFYIGGNPFICNCNIEYLQKINQLTTRQYPKIMDLDTIYCKLLNSRDIAYIPLINAKSKHFLCSYTSHCFALCHCCEFDACDCEMTCPNNCTCFHDQSWSTNIVDCSGALYNEIPSNIPMDTTEVYLDGNNLIELSSHSFIGRKNLMVLYVNNSNIQFIYNTTFSGLKRLIILNLSNNKLTDLYGMEFNSLENLKELYLNDNKISYISNGTFNYLIKLEILRLDNNKLIQFDIYNQLDMNKNLINIYLANNLWSCECSYLSKLRNYLQLNSDKILDANRVACIYNNMSSVLKEKNGTKCTLREGISTYVHGNKIENLLPLLLVGTCAFIGFFGLILGLFCYRNEIYRFIRSTRICKWCFKTNQNYDDDTNNKNRFYDAYICNSIQDDHFVNQVLADTLENIGYRLSLHYRDLNLNLYITDAILETIECSKQAILILSKNFLYNEWTRFEYKSALHELTTRRKKLIIILYGDLPTRDIDADLRHYLKTNTCIEWDDKKFWQKLRIALPEPNKIPCIKTRSAFNIYGASHHNYTMDRNNLAGKSYDCRSMARINNYSKTYDSNFEKFALPPAGFLPDVSASAVSATSSHHFHQKCDDYMMTKCKTLPNDDNKKSKLKDNTMHMTNTSQTQIQEQIPIPPPLPQSQQIQLPQSQIINNKINFNNQKSICNISVNDRDSISSGNSSLSRTNSVCNNDCNDCNDYSECKITNNDDDIEENKISSYMWS